MNTMTIGQVADLTGLGIETIRYYEREGLVDTPMRDRSGYRQYADFEIRQLTFIKHAKHLGFSLKDIRELMDLRLDDDARCEDVRSLAAGKLARIEEKIEMLQRMKRTLAELVSACKNNQKTEQCPILDALEEDVNAAAQRT